MNQFDRLGDISYLTINETDKSFKEFMESTLGFPIPIKYVGDNAGRVAGWPPDPADDYVDRSFAVKVVNQDVADLLSYLSDVDRPIIGEAVLVFIPGGCGDYTVPADQPVIVMLPNEWDHKVREESRLRAASIKMVTDATYKSLREVRGMPDFTPFKDEETV